MYQIYPRSFKDSNNDGTGDLEGILQKLDYLNDGTENSLGIGAIWLSPIYKSPMADFGYDVSNYQEIDPIFGNMETFEKLVNEAHNRGIKVLMDFVPNHTSSRHNWFQESKSSKDNPKRDWYIWKDPKEGGGPPNNWLSVFGGPAWTLDETTGQYYQHSFLPEQPDLNWRNPQVRDEMMKILEFWLHKGVDGFRTDAVYYMFKDPEFKDDPYNPQYREGIDTPYDQLLHTNSRGHEEILDNVNAMCNLIGGHQEHENTFIISEVYIDLPEMKKFYAACENNKHAPFNFALIGLPWSARVFKKHIDDFESTLTSEDWPNYAVGNHDQPRLVSRYGSEHARIIAMLLLTLRGMPFIYYGDEIGMEDVHIPPHRIQDPFGKKEGGYTRDPQRTPMQWTPGEYAGFAQVEPWLPVMKNHQETNVETQLEDRSSLLSLYKKLIHLRKDSPALLSGEYKSIDANNENVYAFTRVWCARKLYW